MYKTGGTGKKQTARTIRENRTQPVIGAGRGHWVKEEIAYGKQQELFHIHYYRRKPSSPTYYRSALKTYWLIEYERKAFYH